MHVDVVKKKKSWRGRVEPVRVSKTGFFFRSYRSETGSSTQAFRLRSGVTRKLRHSSPALASRYTYQGQREELMVGEDYRKICIRPPTNLTLSILYFCTWLELGMYMYALTNVKVKYIDGYSNLCSCRVGQN